MYKKIRIPLDGSALTEAVLTYGEEFAEMEGAEKNLMMASASPLARYSVDHTTPVSDFMETLETQSLIYKQSIQNADIHLSVPARAKPVTETIQEISAEIHADLLVRKRHGCTGVSHWWMGSIAEQASNNSPVPVLLIHSRPE